jgi:3-phenylpropionate/trans-cinnamate dioxygenase ferredoxin reductase component
VQRIVIVGAGLAGLRTAEQLGRVGFTGEVMLVGAEQHPPYTRPPLTKQFLSGSTDVRLALPASLAGVTTAWGVAALAADECLRSITLSDGRTIEADGVVIATGVSPRRVLPSSTGSHVVRTVEDARHVRDQLAPGRHVLVLGAGFVGGEVATSARSRGCEVMVVDAAEEPLQAHLGPLLGAELRRRHEDRGVVFRLGRTVDSSEPGLAVLDDGSVVPADVVVEAVGAAPDLGWLAGTGLDVSDGVRCDARLAAVHSDPLAKVTAAGDCARLPYPPFDPTPRRIEHWNLAVDTARLAARTMVEVMGGKPVGPSPAPLLPSFWSDQAGIRIDCFGIPQLGLRDVRVLEGDLKTTAALGYFGPDGTMLGVALFDRRKGVPTYRRVFAEMVTGRAPG